jgi:Tetratricopeptide repeat/PEGA domain
MDGSRRRKAQTMIDNRLRTRRRLPSASAVALALTLALAAPSAFAAPPAGASAPKAAAAPAGEEASDHFKRGLQLFDEGDYTVALVEFERAYQLAPNYRALYNIALVNMQLGRYADAARTLEKYVADGGDGIPAARRAEVTKTLSELKFRTATVDLSTNVAGAEVTLDGKALEPSALHGPMVIDAGEHTLRASAAGYQTANRTVTLAGRDRVAVRLDLVAVPIARTPPELLPRPRAFFWPGFVAAGGLAAGSVVSGVVMLDARSHLNQLQGTPGSDPGQRASAANLSNSAALAADILAGLAVVTGGVSIYLSIGPDHGAKAPSLAISPQRVVLSLTF